jgi:hypothetical protein
MKTKSNKNMDEINSIISPITIKRFGVQGYSCYSDQELDNYGYGIRFAYYLCDSLMILGLLLTNFWILATIMVIAFLGAVLPNHPFDYLYNYLVRYWINKPKIPRRTNQTKFACGIASVWLGGIIVLFYSGFSILAYIAGGLIVSLATLVATTDICIPSMIYNALFLNKKNK